MRAGRISRFLLCFVVGGGGASCAVGPDFRVPDPVIPAHFPGSNVDDMNHEPGAQWWHEFNDPQLDRLESLTQRGNLDLQAGLLRIVEARTQVQVARAQGLPTLSAVASYNREQLGLAGIVKAQGGALGANALDSGVVSSLTSPINLYQFGFDASWELDLFGRVRRNVEAAQAQSEAAVASRNDMLVTLEAEVAQTYLQLRAAQLLQSITADLIAEDRQILDLTGDRQAHGLAQDADVESARAQASTLQSQLPEYAQNIVVARHALAVLIGQSPETLDAELVTAGNLPTLPRVIPAGLPSQLARRRPDIRQAEASLHAATADVGVSMASLYPDVTLAGTFGLRNTSAHYLFDWASKFYTLGPTISLPLFQGGALLANVKIARAEAASAALNYRKTVLTALREVEDGLANLDQDAVRVAALKDTVAADQRGFDIATHSYRVGLTTYISVLNLQLQSNQAKQQLAQASLSELTDLVKLYKALGGGWETATNDAGAVAIH